MAEDTRLTDHEGYRPCVGIILSNDRGQVFWARRTSGNGWQFPQGGIDPGESPDDAASRELYEETGAIREHTRILACTRNWLHYRIPWLKASAGKGFIGQKQKWFLIQLTAGNEAISLDHDNKPEFDRWRWVSYWYPLEQIIFFKREVYRQALLELAPRLPVDS